MGEEGTREKRKWERRIHDKCGMSMYMEPFIQGEGIQKRTPNKWNARGNGPKEEESVVKS